VSSLFPLSATALGVSVVFGFLPESVVALGVVPAFVFGFSSSVSVSVSLSSLGVSVVFGFLPESVVALGVVPAFVFGLSSVSSDSVSSSSPEPAFGFLPDSVVAFGVVPAFVFPGLAFGSSSPPSSSTSPSSSVPFLPGLPVVLAGVFVFPGLAFGSSSPPSSSTSSSVGFLPGFFAGVLVGLAVDPFFALGSLLFMVSARASPVSAGDTRRVKLALAVLPARAIWQAPSSSVTSTPVKRLHAFLTAFFFLSTKVISILVPLTKIPLAGVNFFLAVP